MVTAYGEEAARPLDPVDAASSEGWTEEPEGVGRGERRTKELERSEKKKEKDTRKKEKDKGEEREEPLELKPTKEEAGGAARAG